MQGILSQSSLRGGTTTVKEERGPGLDYLCFVYVRVAVVHEGLSLLLSFCDY